MRTIHMAHLPSSLLDTRLASSCRSCSGLAPRSHSSCCCSSVTPFSAVRTNFFCAASCNYVPSESNADLIAALHSEPEVSRIMWQHQQGTIKVLLPIYLAVSRQSTVHELRLAAAAKSKILLCTWSCIIGSAKELDLETSSFMPQAQRTWQAEALKRLLKNAKKKMQAADTGMTAQRTCRQAAEGLVHALSWRHCVLC